MNMRTYGVAGVEMALRRAGKGDVLGVASNHSVNPQVWLTDVLTKLVNRWGPHAASMNSCHELTSSPGR